MPQRLKDNGVVPPDGYRWRCRETGYTVRARTRWTWVKSAREHLESNSIPVPADLEEQMHDQLCGQLPPEYCERPEGKGWINPRLKWNDIVDGTKAFLGLAKGGFNFVDPVEAERRAWLCVSCPNNIALSGCGTCRKMATLLTAEVAQRKTPYDADLKACAVCRCAIPAMIHFPMSALEVTDTSEKQALYPSEFCWKSKASPTYQPDMEMATA